MPSAQAIAAAQATTTEFVWIFLVSIGTPGNPVLRLCNNSEPIVSRGETYQPFPFSVKLSTDDGETLPVMQLEFMHLSGEITEAIRGFEQAPDISIELVTNITPDIVERQLSYVKLVNVSYDAMTVSGTLNVINTLSVAFPAESYTPSRYPGLFVN
jgi:hypothetical protein